MYGKARIVLGKDGRIRCCGKFLGDQGGSSQGIGWWQHMDGVIEVYRADGRRHIGDVNTKAEAKQLAHEAACDSSEHYLGQNWIVESGKVVGRTATEFEEAMDLRSLG